MSQRGSAPRPASRRSPEASQEAAFSLPGLSRPGPQGSVLPADASQVTAHDPHGTSGVVKTEEGQGPSPMVRTSDVHGILNASELHHRHLGGGLVFPGQPSEDQSSKPATGGTPPHARGGSPFSPYVFPGGQSSAASVPGYPPPVSDPVPGPPVQPRASPTTGPSLPPLGVPRRILTPRSPRVTSLSRAARRNEELQQNPLPRHPSIQEFHDVSPRSRPTALEVPALRAPQQPQGTGSALPPPTPSPIASRSLSQPIVGHALPPTLAPDYLHAGARPPLPGPAPTRFPSQPTLARDTAPSGPGGEPRWSTGNYGSLAGLPWGRGVPVGESRHLLTITPQFGEEIVVPVDTHQGSKTQDQKRQKNAIASARFRTRKKEREHQLEVDNHELGLRVRELESERDFYRNERNRLRDIVSRTPSISQWASGPPSPVSNREQGNFPAETGSMGGTSHGQGVPGQSPPAARRRRGPQARSPPRPGASYTVEGSTMTSGPRPRVHPYPQPPPAPYSYGAPEPSMAEPPARRRRLDEPQFTMPTYGGPPPPSSATLPAMAPVPYGLNPPRQSPTPPALPRLPPLRMDQPSPGSDQPPQAQPGPVPRAPPPPPPPPPQQQQAAQAPPYNPSYGRVYETGWAQAPPGCEEGGPK